MLFARDGFAGTSMADIIAESGLSAGSIYSHFESKADLIRFVAANVLETRATELLADLRARLDAPAPVDVVATLLRGVGIEHERATMLLQVWAEIPRDDELAQIVIENMSLLRPRIARTLLPWARNRDADRAEDVASAGADTAIALMQGSIARLAIDADMDAAALAGILLAALS